MKQWISSLAIALAFVAALGVTSASAQVIVIEEDETVAPATMPRVLMEPQPGAVVVQPEPSAVVVQPAAPVVVVQTRPNAVVVQAQPWCAGAYEPSLGANFAPCPGAVVAH
ncbi:MAG: hypothetical protein E6K82_18635 [Candidatus Rokuibacteriota bacterium]|nr:MAG: hypothetical protein E6K82_18635 [Candidatus Rokubacteria bacterium]